MSLRTVAVSHLVKEVAIYLAKELLCQKDTQRKMEKIASNPRKKIEKSEH
jgi:hypothetical protein